VVIIGFIWQLILSPLWGVGEKLMGLVGLADWFAPWLGQESTALLTLSLISVWQYVGIPMMLIYAALLAVPEEVLEAAHAEGASAMRIFWQIKLPLIYPTLGLVTILTFVANFNAFDLIYSVKGALAGPNYASDLLGTCSIAPSSATRRRSAAYHGRGGGDADVPGDPGRGGGLFRDGAASIDALRVRRHALSSTVGTFPLLLPTTMRKPSLIQRSFGPAGHLWVHAVLCLYAVIALFPIALILINSVKTRNAIFEGPMALPTAETLTFAGFQKVLAGTHFLLYFGNSLVVTLAALLLIVLFGAMAAWALTEYRFFGNRALNFFMPSAS
jgi:ABC-type sugar transport system permease subunit